MNRFIETNRLTNKTTRTRRSRTTTINNIIDKFTDIIRNFMIFFTIVLLQRHLRGHLIAKSPQAIDLLITLLRTDNVGGHIGGTEGTVTSDIVS